jgi:hypothetical protein
MILDLDRIARSIPLSADVVVVGAGAVGIVVGTELARHGIRTVVLESGGHLLEHQSQQLSKGRLLGHHHEGLEKGRFRILGGNTNFWGGQIAEFEDAVFDDRRYIGIPSWPITRKIIAPHYLRAYELLGVDSELLRDDAVWRKIGRSAPNLCPDTEVVLTRWLRETNFSPLFRKSLEDKSGPTIVLHANVTGFTSQQTDGRITTVEARSLSGRSVSVNADKVVLACGSIEIARLLLWTGMKTRTSWSDNRWVGKCFLDHLDCVAATVHPIDPTRFHDLFDNIYIGRSKFMPKLKASRSAQKRLTLLEIAGSFLFRSRFSEHLENLRLFVRSIGRGVRFSQLGGLLGHLSSMGKYAVPMIARYLKERRAFNLSDEGTTFVLHCEQFPNRDSYVSLSGETDSLGIPQVALHWRFSGSEIETMARFTEIVGRTLSRATIAELSIDPGLKDRDASFANKIYDGNHQMGAARMAEDASLGVVDSEMRVFGSPNLYVAGQAVFPSSGYANPTFTAIALALRLVERFVSDFRK